MPGNHGNHRNGRVKNEAHKWILLRKQTLSRSVACKQGREGKGNRARETGTGREELILAPEHNASDEEGSSKGQEGNPVSVHASERQATCGMLCGRGHVN